MKPRVRTSWDQTLFTVGFILCVFWSLLAYLMYLFVRTVWTRTIEFGRTLGGERPPSRTGSLKCTVHADIRPQPAAGLPSTANRRA